MPHDLSSESPSELIELREEEKKLRILFRIAVQIKAGSLPESYSQKGKELANKYEGEDLEGYAYGDF